MSNTEALLVLLFVAAGVALPYALAELHFYFRGNAIEARENARSSGCGPRFVCEHAQQAVTADEQTLVATQGIGATGTGHRWRVQCGWGQCNRDACPWQQFVGERHFLKSIIVDRTTRGWFRKFAKPLFPEDAARAHPDLADANGCVPGVYELDPDLTFWFFPDRLGSPCGHQAAGCDHQPDHVNLDLGPIADESAPRGEDAENRTQQPESKAQIFHVLRSGETLTTKPTV